MSHHIFLSYSRKDSEIMQRVKGDFEAAGLSIWTDEGIEPGTPNWQRAIQNAILDAGCLVGILSPDAAQSDWVWEELNFARTQQKPIYLFLSRGDERNAVPFGFSTFQWVDIRADGQYSEGLARLIQTVRERLAVEGGVSYTLKSISASVSSLQPPDLSGILPPPFEWCEVPAGMVTIVYGEWRGGEYNVNHSRNFKTERFWLAKYPITNDQFQVFLDHADGFNDPEWWTFSYSANQWRQLNIMPSRTIYNGHNLPRTRMTWYEAVAFCRWLNWKANLLPSSLSPREQQYFAPEHSRRLPPLTIRLPTEYEWQRAAQGDEGRMYPWGNLFDKRRANVWQSYIHSVTPVTQYSNGESPFGVIDMCGNVWEWCLTDWQTGLNLERNFSHRVLRGGSWLSDARNACCSSRVWNERNGQWYNIWGFRISCSLNE